MYCRREQVLRRRVSDACGASVLARLTALRRKSLEWTGKGNQRYGSFVGLLLLATLVLLAPTHLEAVENVEIGKDFRIYRDFRDFKIQRHSLVFFNDDKIFVGDDAEQDRINTEKLRLLAREQLKPVLSFAPKNAAEYMLVLRMHYYTNYAIRNIERKPAKGLVLLGLCRLPANKTEDDCQSHTFYFFENHELNAVFNKVVGMWIDRIILAELR
jgi:hypothetical protein